MMRVLFSVMCHWSRRLIGLLVLVQLLPLSLPAHSAEAVTTAEDPARQVHWAMGAFFGTGWYRVDNNRNVYILRVPPSQTLRESSMNANGERTLGIEIQYPVSFGVHNLDALDDFLDFDNYATVSFTPGIQVEIPVTEKWYLRPYANLGWGTETKSSDSAWIFYGGVKSRYRLGGDQVSTQAEGVSCCVGHAGRVEDGAGADAAGGASLVQPVRYINSVEVTAARRIRVVIASTLTGTIKLQKLNVTLWDAGGQ